MVIKLVAVPANHPPSRVSFSTSQISWTPSLKNTTLYSNSPRRPSYTDVGNKASNASDDVIL